ncbi:MAG: hypothetical protein DUD31_03410 [Coriobacteriaceae bacterium]|nr:MAG: hypothetical protein DUD31_03410 [Coriobacteriaceae bacterium]
MRSRSSAAFCQTIWTCSMGPMQRWSWDKCRYGEELLSKIAGRGVQVLVTRTIGMDHIDLDAAARLGIAVGNAHYAPDSVADFSLMLMLVALRHCKAAVCQQNVNDYSLGGLEGRTLSSLAVGVVGTGAIGAAVVQRPSGFGCEILATGHHANPEVAKRADNVSQDELFRASDVMCRQRLQTTIWCPVNRLPRRRMGWCS